MPSAETPPVSAGGRVEAHIWRIATVVILGSLMSLLDTTIVNVALDSLSRDLHTTLSGIQWVVTGYLLSLAAVIPLSGWAARRLGPKRLYLISIALFTIGSALCGLATSPAELIFFRVIQGVGGGMIMPVGQMIMVRAAGPKNLARVMSAIGVPIVMAPVLGPTIGGLILDNIGWRWIFYVNVPIGIIAVLAGLRKLPAEPPEDAGPFDMAGLMLVATGLIGLTYGLAEVGMSGGSAMTHVIVPLVVGLLLVGAFVVRALHIDRPLLDVRLYLHRAYSASSLTMFCFGAALFGGMILMPLYFQNIRGEDALYTGLLLAPRGVGSALGTWMSGRMTDRLGSGVTAAIGGIIALGFTAPFVALGSNTSYLMICVVMAVGGYGLGLATMPAMTAGYRVLEPSQIHDASPQLNIIMRVGGSIGTAILTVILQHHLTSAGRSIGAQAAAFGYTFWWVVALTAVAVLPTFYLIQAERRHDTPTPPDGEPVAEAVAMIEAG